jgi:hypothetical protein
MTLIIQRTKETMYKISKILLAALVAATTLALAVGSAAARNRIEISPTAILASGRLTFQGPINVECDVTLHITARRLISKVLGTQLGGITAILTANATGNVSGPTCTPLAGMLVFYEGITGSLPSSIRGGILAVTSRFQIGEAGFFRCLYTATIRGTSRENPARRATINPNRFSECFTNGELLGELRFNPEVSIRLLEP